MQIFKKLRVTAVVASVLALSITPTTLAIDSAAGQSGQTKNTTTPAKNQMSAQARCDAIAKIAERLQTQLTERKAKVDSKRANVALKTNQTAENREAKLAEKRAEWDKKREENFDKLREKATTEGQKEAVEAYVVAISEAIKTRREANDAAFATFKSDLAALKAGVSQSVEQNVSAANAKIAQAATNAQTACEGGQDITTVKQTLKSEIDAAREQLKTTRESNTKSAQLKAIVQKRNDAVRANAIAFKQATEQARQELKAAFETTNND